MRVKMEFYEKCLNAKLMFVLAVQSKRNGKDFAK